MQRNIPHCHKCNRQHYNLIPCEVAAKKKTEYLKAPLPPGMKEWKENDGESIFPVPAGMRVWGEVPKFNEWKVR